MKTSDAVDVVPAAALESTMIEPDESTCSIIVELFCYQLS